MYTLAIFLYCARLDRTLGLLYQPPGHIWLTLGMIGVDSRGVLPAPRTHLTHTLAFVNSCSLLTEWVSAHTHTYTLSNSWCCLFVTNVRCECLTSWLCFLHTFSTVNTRSSAIAGRPCDAKACQGLLKWTWKWQPRLKWPSNVLQGHQKWYQSKATISY